MSVKLFAVRLSNPIEKNVFDNLIGLLDVPRKNKIRQRLKNDADLMLCGDILSRYAIKAVFRIPIRGMFFGVSDFGKPYIQGHSDVHFNISHSGKVVVCAVGDEPVGIDIQKIKDINFDPIVKKFFTEKEQAFMIKSLNKKSDFFKIWTKKESYLKYKGSGIAVGVRDICYDGCEFNHFNLGGEYQVCFCKGNKKSALVDL